MNEESACTRLPRRLAIEVLAHAQRLAGNEVLEGVIQASGGAPSHFRPGRQRGLEPVWAQVGALPESGPPILPEGVVRMLTVGLGTKGVLQLRCWERDGASARERQLRVSD